VSAFAPPRAGSTRHLVWLYQPASRRDAMTTLFALEREIASSARPDLDHAVTHARLDWWQMETQRLAAGQPSHPLGVSLLAALRTTSAPAPDFEPLVETMRWAVACTAFEDRAELSQCFDAWSRTVFVTAVQLCAMQPQHASLEVLREAGSALREVEALRRLRADATLGRVHLPLAELEALQLTISPSRAVPGTSRSLQRSANVCVTAHTRCRLCRRSFSRRKLPRCAPSWFGSASAAAAPSAQQRTCLFSMLRAAPTASPMHGAPGAPRAPSRRKDSPLNTAASTFDPRNVPLPDDALAGRVVAITGQPPA
jgi:phytoene/squalene synthetase